jgi:tRNA (cytidine/uridine-2'-O-)-methyltransferase
LHTDQEYTESDYFIFGSEGQGLPEIILNHSSIKDVLRIPMIEGNRSLNLSNSVSVVAYEVLRQTKFSSLK